MSLPSGPLTPFKSISAEMSKSEHRSSDLHCSRNSFQVQCRTLVELWTTLLTFYGIFGFLNAFLSLDQQHDLTILLRFYSVEGCFCRDVNRCGIRNHTDGVSIFSRISSRRFISVWHFIKWELSSLFYVYCFSANIKRTEIFSLAFEQQIYLSQLLFCLVAYESTTTAFISRSYRRFPYLCFSTNLTTFALLQASTTNQEIDNRLTNLLAATIYSSNQFAYLQNQREHHKTSYCRLCISVNTVTF